YYAKNFEWFTDAYMQFLAHCGFPYMETFHNQGISLALEAVNKYGITFLVGVHSILKMLYNAQLKHPEDLSNLKGIVTMGSPLEREDCIKFQKTLTPNIFNGYGTSDAF
ncbi:MAG: AMP-binding protein, partial [Tuberibacillus sp.]